MGTARMIDYLLSGCDLQADAYRVYLCMDHHSLLPSALRKNPVDGFSAGLVDDDNVYEWEVRCGKAAQFKYELDSHPSHSFRSPSLGT